MKLFKHASNDDLESVATEVIEQLHKAGIYAFRLPKEMDRGEDSGVEVAIDSIDGGIYLSWYPGAHLTNLAVKAMQKKRLDDPSIWRSGEIQRTKLKEIASVLNTVGIQTEDSQNDYAPLSLWIRMTNSSKNS